MIFSFYVRVRAVRLRLRVLRIHCVFPGLLASCSSGEVHLRLPSLRIYCVIADLLIICCAGALRLLLRNFRIYCVFSDLLILCWYQSSPPPPALFGNILRFSWYSRIMFVSAQFTSACVSCGYTTFFLIFLFFVRVRAVRLRLRVLRIYCVFPDLLVLCSCGDVRLLLRSL